MHDLRRTAVLERDAPPTALTTPPAPKYPTVDRLKTQAAPDREQMLYDLADEARARGMNDREWYENQNIGSCPAQVDVRIEMLVDWLAAHPVPAA